ncbi:MAG: hypothetical protein M1827_006755 [Pycnora praestabilis]|nr:MAG: hypothetical protein M1827_006755 [Pycnora praestabilis]
MNQIHVAYVERRAPRMNRSTTHADVVVVSDSFTKSVYSPQMPQSLPMPVFLRHVFLHSLSTLVTWSRFLLVSFVWLGWLPWSMRAVWRLLFWLGDGGWAAWQHPRNNLAYYAKAKVELAANGTSPVRAESLMSTASAAKTLPSILQPFSQTLNMSSGEPTVYDLLRKFFLGFQKSDAASSLANDASATNSTSGFTLLQRRSSWLSEFSFLNQLTRSTTFNNILIDTLEGQLITLFVVITFILVFLIREWVVQQQPAIHMGVEFNADIVGGQDGAARALQQNENAEDANARNDQDGEVRDNRRPMAVPRPRGLARAPLQERQESDLSTSGETSEAGVGRGAEFEDEHDINRPQDSVDDTPRSPSGSRLENAIANQRPFPARNALSTASEILRSIEEGQPDDQQWPGLVVFMEVWNRANKNPGEVIRIIEEENHMNELSWIVDPMKRLMKLQEPSESPLRALNERDTNHESIENDQPSQNKIKDSATGCMSAEILGSNDDNDHDKKEGKISVGGFWSGQNVLRKNDRFQSGEEVTNSSGGYNLMDKGKAREVDVSSSESTRSAPDVSGSLRSLQQSGSDSHGTNIRHLQSQTNESSNAPTKTFGNSGSDSDSEDNIDPSLSEWPPSLALTEARKGEARDRKGEEIGKAKLDDSDEEAITTPSEEGEYIANKGFESNIEPIIFRRVGRTTVNEQTRSEPASSDPEIIDPIADGHSDDFEHVTKDELHVPTDSIGDNPFHPDYIEDVGEDMDSTQAAPPLATRPPNQDRPAEMIMPQSVPTVATGITEQIMDWLWGDVAPAEQRQEDIGQNDEHIVQNMAEEAPFVHVDRPAVGDDEIAAPEGLDHNPEVIGAAGQAAVDGNDQEVVEEAEDFEGVMELIGMRGPVMGLFQNGLFSAVLISATVGGGVWLPYIWGKVVLLLLGNPVSLFVKLPLRWASMFMDVVVDLFLYFMGWFVYWLDNALHRALAPVAIALPFAGYYTESTTISTGARSVAEGGLERFLKLVFSAGIRPFETEYPIFSMLSHEALHNMQSGVVSGAKLMHLIISTCYNQGPLQACLLFHRGNETNGDLTHTTTGFLILARRMFHELALLVPSLLKPNSVKISLDIPERTTPINTDLAYWGTSDRVIAIVMGYAFFATLGALYLKRGKPFSYSESGKKVEAVIAEVLQQAGGVLKVILIISIEMIVFPLYCGLLLDLALLPLFEKATILSRIAFTVHSPWTSAFVHWFVGTCYMFHFALFVSMCRKIMRSGVLYFIRDPDDPTFHPVRDVLERSVTTQLRKITFSALVYGALVIICLGGVVWGLSLAFDGVLPVHWSSNEPVLEFPVDLLFYNFLMPLAVKFYKPSDGLYAMYNEWFKACARMLRLTHFLFGERQEDEEGHHVRRTWWDILAGKKGDAQMPVIGDDRKILAEDRDVEVYFLRDGKYVRTPASDQVRIPKGGKVFLEVNDDNVRVDGQPDLDEGLHGRKSDLFTKVYVPPYFGLRIGLFILSIWLFAAATGVAFTIVPLVFGRMVFAIMIPKHPRMNDVYAFSIGFYTLGGIFYGGLHYQVVLAFAKTTLIPHVKSVNHALHQIYDHSLRCLRVLYTYTAFAFVLPTLFALLMEFYIIIPTHTYLSPDQQHIIHSIQDWTLGVLYVKIAARLILWYPASRPAIALRAIIRDGWLHPDVRLATRAFILPAVTLMGAALVVPLPFAWLVNTLFVRKSSVGLSGRLYRYSYPALLATGFAISLLYLLGLAVKGWRQRIKDEVYLIGERLHNFGERRARTAASKRTSHASEASALLTGTKNINQMTFLTHHSRHSWPPFDLPTTISPGTSKPKSIDENPFAFFVSPSDNDPPTSIFESDIFDDDDWNAGILSLPSSSHRHNTHRNDPSSVALAARTPAAILRRWANYVEKHHPRLASLHHNPRSVLQGISPSNSATSSPSSSPRLGSGGTQAQIRRGGVNLSPVDGGATRQRGRPQMRSRSSGHRHSWREPSVDLWTVEEGTEEIEKEDIGNRDGEIVIKDKLQTDTRRTQRRRENRNERTLRAQRERARL